MMKKQNNEIFMDDEIELLASCLFWGILFCRIVV